MRKLTEIDIDEISLVDIPAIKTTYFIVKRDSNSEKIKKEVNKMDELIKLYKSLYKEEIAKEMKPDIKKFGEEDIKALKNALDIFKKNQDDLPDELDEAIVSLAKFAVSEYPKEEKEEKKDDTEVEKSGAKLSKDSLANLKKAIECLMSILPEEDVPEVKKADEKVEEKVEKKEESKEEVKEEVEKVDDTKETLEKSLKELKDSILEEIAKSNKTVEDVAKRLEKVEEVKGVKKSVDEETVEKEKKEVKKDGWPSLMPEENE